jgi:DNA-binding response OmpR family regulator
VARILIAEDDPRIAALLEKGLRANGYSPFLVADGEQAQRLGLTGDFDLMILDMGLPERDGFQVLQGLRARGQSLPIIILTGRTEREAAACLEAGADDYMRKPFHFDELLARVRKRLRARAELARLERIVDELELPGIGGTDPVRHERNASA